jgi:peptidoglycan/LPS O-acetylase OafA/YrhL
MLQRIQSFWLLLASAAGWLTLEFPVYSGVRTDDKAYHMMNARDQIGILVLTVLLSTALLVTIFLFKKRKVQLRVALLCLLASFLNLVLYYLQIKNFTQGAFNLSAIFPLAVPVCVILAIRGIIKDQKLIKSLDRLR